MVLVALAGAATAVAVALWAVWNPDDLGVGFWSVELAGALVAVAGLTLARGCFVEIDPSADELRDVVAWRTRRRTRRSAIVEARVRAGAWRWFELELAGGDRLTLAGIAPVQFPARLFAGARERDLADLDLLMGTEGATLGDG